MNFAGDYASLCISSSVEEESFNLTEFGVDDLVSFECGDRTSYSLCNKEANSGDCISGDGPVAFPVSGFAEETVWATLKYQAPKTNLD